MGFGIAVMELAMPGSHANLWCPLFAVFLFSLVETTGIKAGNGGLLD